MNQDAYYLAYERRYRAVYAAGGQRWGHAPDDPGLVDALTRWVARYRLEGRRVLEFACGEGATGVILSGLGCGYHGVDIAPSAVEKARAALAGFPAATVAPLDMVHQRPEGRFDGAVDIMGFHMLITDAHRQAYLSNALAALKPGAPMLFFRQSLDSAAHPGPVESYEHWLALSDRDYKTPQLRRMVDSGVAVEVPLVPARPQSKAGYVEEITRAGFVVEDFQVLEPSRQNPCGAAIWAHKG